MDGIKLRLGMAGLLTVLAGGAGPSCGVRNVTQATAGGSFVVMVAAAAAGDRLRVRDTRNGGP